MKNKLGLFLFLPLLLSCGGIPKISYETAQERLHNIELKYDDFNNVEHDFEANEAHQTSAGLYTCNAAFDSESKIYYQYIKYGNQEKPKIIYQYFEDKGEGRFDFMTLVNDGNSKKKFREQHTGVVGEDYFRQQFQNELKNRLSEIRKIMTEIAKENGDYRAFFDSDLYFNFTNENNAYAADIHRNRLNRFYVAKINSAGQRDDELTFTYSYERFAVSVNPDEYEEQH